MGVTKQDILRRTFGYDSFRSGQEEVIDAILKGQDVLGIMPTGAGKSICYQVPALMLPGVTVVISPLISLMKDQVQALNEAGVHAAYLNSSLTEGQIAKAIQLAATNRYKIIYVAPERLETPRFQWLTHQIEISMVTVDEAHCISAWGQDFRPSYLAITDFIKTLPKRPVVSAFTATATHTVRDDIIRVLELQDPKVLVTGFDRKNLYWRVEKPKDKTAFVIAYLHQHEKESGIIYCSTRKNVDTLCDALNDVYIPAGRYHAGMDAADRAQSQDDFIYDRTSVMVATNAFGMGIDKSNVRFVIHYNMPSSIENYYQEAGRAGRDGEDAECILLYSVQDVMIDRYLIENKEGNDQLTADEQDLIRRQDLIRLSKMEHYCTGTGCLRNDILSYFGEQVDKPCGHCGNCDKEYEELDVTDAAKSVISLVTGARRHYGKSLCAAALAGHTSAKLRQSELQNSKEFGALSSMSEMEIRDLILFLVDEGYLRQSEDAYQIILPGRWANEVASGKTILWKREKKSETETAESSAKRRKRSRSFGSTVLSDEGNALAERLRQLRLTIARSESVPPYLVFNDKTLFEMAAKLPQNEEEMLAISGVGEKKMEAYGHEFLSEIKGYLTDYASAHGGAEPKTTA